MSLQQSETNIIKTQLVQMTIQLEKKVKDQLEIDHQDGELERGGNDGGDEAKQALQIGMDVEQTSRTAYTLQLARDALSRLNAEEYGLCLECENEIDTQRLLANPIAKRCIECQSVHEKLQRSNRSSASI